MRNRRAGATRMVMIRRRKNRARFFVCRFPQARWWAMQRNGSAPFRPREAGEGDHRASDDGGGGAGLNASFSLQEFRRVRAPPSTILRFATRVRMRAPRPSARPLGRLTIPDNRLALAGAQHGRRRRHRQADGHAETRQRPQQAEDVVGRLPAAQRVSQGFDPFPNDLAGGFVRYVLRFDRQPDFPQDGLLQRPRMLHVMAVFRQHLVGWAERSEAHAVLRRQVQRGHGAELVIGPRFARTRWRLCPPYSLYGFFPYW